jgi:hypothetical protein
MTDTRVIVTIARPLDKRPFTAHTLHCSECGNVHEGEHGPTWWNDEMIAKLSRYFGDDGWHEGMAMADPDMDGRALVCPKCWEVTWCEGCNSAIHIWQPYEAGSDGTHWHLDCCGDDHEHPVVACKTCHDTGICTICRGGGLNEPGYGCTACDNANRCHVCSAAKAS